MPQRHKSVEGFLNMMHDSTAEHNRLSRSKALLVPVALCVPLVVVYATKMLLPLLAVVGLFTLVVAPWRGVRLDWRFFVPCLILLGAAVGLPWATNVPEAYQSFLKTGALMGFGCLVLAKTDHLAPQTHSLFWAKVLAWSSVVALVLRLLEHTPIGGPAHWVLSSEAFENFILKDSNRGLCAAAVLVWPLSALLWHAHEKRMAIVLVLLLAVAVFVGASASAAVAMAAGAVALSVAFFKNTTLTNLYKAALLACVVAFPLVAHALFKTLSTWPLPVSFLHRLYIWDFAWQKFLTRPVTGFGMDASRTIEGGQDLARGTLFINLPLHPHNAMAQTLLEQGLVGYAAVSMAVGYIVFAAQKPLEIICLSAFIGPAMFAFGMWQGWWIAVGFLAAFLCGVSVKQASA